MSSFLELYSLTETKEGVRSPSEKNNGKKVVPKNPSEGTNRLLTTTKPDQ